MRSFGFCARQSNHANISSLNCSNNRYTIKNTLYWRLWFQGPELKPSFVLICLFLYSVAFSSVSIKKRSLFDQQRLNLSTHAARHGENALWLVIFNSNSFPFMVELDSRGAWKQCPMIGHNYSNLFPFMVTFTASTWPTNISLRLVRIISNLCPFLARLTTYVFNGFTTHSRKPQRKMYKIGIFFIYYKKFINR